MNLPTRPYLEQQQVWPQTGRHILAHFDEETIVVYQAYGHPIGDYAIRHGRFGGKFRYTRMSWIKPNFLWMMYRSNWGQSEGQEVVLGIRLRCAFFDSLLAQAVPSSYTRHLYEDEQQWKDSLAASDVRLQWDPDHLPTGGKCERRAVQLGLRGDTLLAYGQREVLEIIDMSEFVSEQRQHLHDWKDGTLVTPAEDVYLPENPKARTQVGLQTKVEHDE